MLIKDCMTRHPVLVSPNTSATEAQQIMAENRIRHLPVVGDGKRLQGLITRERLTLKSGELGSLNVWEITRFLSDLKVNRVMLKRKDVFTTTPDHTVERAAGLMREHKIGCLPVLEDGEVVVGIVTQVDLLGSFQEMLGMPHPGVRVTMRMPNRPGEFAKLMKVLSDHRWDVMGIGTFPARRHPEVYKIVLKIPRVTPEEVKTVLGEVPEQDIVDLRTVV